MSRRANCYDIPVALRGAAEHCRPVGGPAPSLALEALKRGDING